jgi:hypothetical protein
VVIAVEFPDYRLGPAEFLVIAVYLAFLGVAAATVFRAAARESAQRATGWIGEVATGILSALAISTYAAAVTVIAVGGYFGWREWRVERAEATRARQECARQADARNANEFVIDATGRRLTGTPAKRKEYYDTCVASAARRGED